MKLTELKCQDIFQSCTFLTCIRKQFDPDVFSLLEILNLVKERVGPEWSVQEAENIFILLVGMVMIFEYSNSHSRRLQAQNGPLFMHVSTIGPIVEPFGKQNSA